MKRVLILMIALIIFLPNITKADSDISIILNGNKIKFPDVQPIIDENNRTLVPVRFISEALGAEVSWNQELKQVTIEKDSNTIKLIIGENKATVNDKVVEFDSKAILKDSRTLVPVRFISETLGVKVDWDNETRTVLIGENDINKLKSKYVKETLYNDKIVAIDDWSKETVTIVPPTKESIETFNKVINIIAENEKGNYQIGIHKTYGASILVGENDLNLKYYITIEDKPNQRGDIYISCIKDFSNETVKKYKEILKVIFPTEYEKVFSLMKNLYDTKNHRNYNNSYKADGRVYYANYSEVQEVVNIFIGEKVK